MTVTLPNNYTITWEFPELEVITSIDGFSQVVKTIHWRVTVNDGGQNSATAYNSMTLPLPDPNVNTFIPFNTLTENVVSGWLYDLLNTANTPAPTANVDTIITSLVTDLQNRVAPMMVNITPPWVTVDTTANTTTNTVANT